MLATDLLSPAFKRNISKLSKLEFLIFENSLFVKLCEHLKEILLAQYRIYFQLIKLSLEMEEKMIEGHFIKYIVDDIVKTGEYTLPGIAYHTRIPEEVLHDITIGRNPDPSSTSLRKIIKLHQSVRPSLYRDLIVKVISEKENS